MVPKHNSTSGRPNFHVVARRTSQINTLSTNEATTTVSKSRWWKLLERLSLILGLIGFSITSLVAGVEKYLEKAQAFEALQTKVMRLEERLAHLEAANSRIENELNFIKGKLEQPRAATVLAPENDLTQTDAPSRVLNSTRGAATVHSQARAAQSLDPRAPLHIIDKLNMTINYAYSKARSANPSLAGRLSVKCVLDEEGNLADSEVVALDPEVEEVAANVRDKVRRWNFPETVTGLEEGSFQKTYFLTPSGL